MSSPQVPFSDEVLHICASLSQYATVEDIREAMVVATADVNLFLKNSPSEEAENVSCKKIQEESQNLQRAEKAEEWSGDVGTVSLTGGESKRNKESTPSSVTVETEVLMISELLQCSDSNGQEQSHSFCRSGRDRAPSIRSAFLTASSDSSLETFPATKNSKSTNNNSNTSNIVVYVSLNTPETLERMKIRNLSPHRRGMSAGKQRLSLLSSVLSESNVQSSPNTSWLEIPLSCIFISRKQRIDENTGRILPASSFPSSGHQKLDIKDVCIQSLDVTRPLDVLECALRYVYEPMFRKRSYHLDISTPIRELLQKIQAMRRRLPEFRARDYVERNIIAVCEAHPRLSPPQLVEHLGDLKVDTKYIQKVKQIKEESKTVLENPSFLSRLNGDYYDRGGEDGNLVERIGSAEVHSVVSEKEQDWKLIANWVDEVLRELKQREWEVACLLLRSSGDTSYVREYQQHREQIDRLLSYLGTIRVVKEWKDTASFYHASTQAMEAICKAPESFLFLSHSLLREITGELLCRWVASALDIKTCLGGALLGSNSGMRQLDESSSFSYSVIKTSPRGGEKKERIAQITGVNHPRSPILISRGGEYLGTTAMTRSRSSGDKRWNEEEDEEDHTDVLLGKVDDSLEVTQWLVEKYTYMRNSLALPSSSASSCVFASRSGLRRNSVTPPFPTLKSSAPEGISIITGTSASTTATALSGSTSSSSNSGSIGTSTSAGAVGGGSTRCRENSLESTIELFRERLIHIQGFLELHTLRLHRLQAVFASNASLRSAWVQYTRSDGSGEPGKKGKSTFPSMVGSHDGEEFNGMSEMEEGRKDAVEAVADGDEAQGGTAKRSDGFPPLSSPSLSPSRNPVKNRTSNGREVERDVLAVLKNAFNEFVEKLYSSSLCCTGGSGAPEYILWGINPRSTELLEVCMNEYHSKVGALDRRLANFVNHVLSQQYARRVMTTNTDGSSSEVVHTTHSTEFLWAFARFQWIPLPHVKQVLRQYHEKVEEQLESLYSRIRMDYYNTERMQPIWRLSQCHLGLSKFAAAIVSRRDFVLSLKRYDDLRYYLLEKQWHQLLMLRQHHSHYWCLNRNLADFLEVPLEAMVRTWKLKAGSAVHGCAIALAYLQRFYPNNEGWKADPYLHLAKQLVEKEEPGAEEKATKLLIGCGVHNRTTVRELKGFSTIYEDSKNRLFQSMVTWLEYAFSKVCMLKKMSVVHPENLTLQGPILSIVDVTYRADALAKRQRGVDQETVVYPVLPTVTRSSPADIGWMETPLRQQYLAQQQELRGIKGSFTKKESYYQLDVVFPTIYFDLALDVRYIEGTKLFTMLPESQYQEMDEIQKFVQCNEQYSRWAVSLTEMLRMYYSVVNGEDHTLSLLAPGPYREVNELLMDACRLHWEQEREVENLLESLTGKLLLLEEKVQKVRQQSEAVYKRIIRMHNNPYHPETIVQTVHDIGTITTALRVGSPFADVWVERQVQPLLDAALVDQLRFLFHGWTTDFLSMMDNPQFLDPAAETAVFHLRPLRLHMVVVFKVVRLEKPPQAWRCHWLQRLNDYFQWINTIPRLCAPSDQDVNRVSSSDECSSVLVKFPFSQSSQNGGYGGNSSELHLERDYRYILRYLPPCVLEEPLKAIEKCIQDTISAEREWQISQQFLNIDINVIQQRFGTDLRRWVHAIGHMRHVTKQIIDVTQPYKLLGGIVICVEGVQNELSRKFDQILQFVLSKFIRVLEQQMNASSSRIKKAFNKAELWNVITKNDDAMEFLSEESNIAKELAETDELVELFVESENTLLDLGHLFPDNWIRASRIKEDYRSLKDLINRKKTAVEVRHAELVESVNLKVQQLEQSMLKVKSQVNEIDTQHGRRTTVVVQQLVEDLCATCTALETEAKKIHHIQDALGVPAADISSLENMASIVVTLKDVWGRASQVDQRLQSLCGTLFFEVRPQWVQGELQAIEAELASFPVSLKAFLVFQDLLGKVQFIGSCRRYLIDLRSDAMAPLERAQRHWIILKQRLSAPWILERLTLQDILNSNPVQNASIYNGVLEVAQGERGIEVQLGHISSFWESFQLSLTLYKKQTCLIRGWDALFDRLADDLGSCSGMRASPFFRAPPLISAVNEVENRLNNLRQILEMLVEIQKRWVYLDGIFTGNNEIRMQLPHDTVQFERTTREFMTVLPRPRAGGALPDVGVQFFLQDEKLHQTLERLTNQITEVQHALTAYLDGQRRRFPRLFFVGDDDLLEIMGNGGDPNFLSRHLRKMFTGLSSFLVEPETLRLRGFSSVEGEVVLYRTISSDPNNQLSPVLIEVKQRPLYGWMLEAENRMVTTLKSETMIATQTLLDAGAVTMEWIKSHPTQILCLSLQLWWVALQEKHFSSLCLPRVPHAGDSTQHITSHHLQEDRGGLHHRSERRVIQPGGSNRVGNAARTKSPVTEAMDKLLAQLASSVLGADVERCIRHRFEQMITIAVYQRDISRSLVLADVRSPSEFEWSRVLRPYIRNNKPHGGGEEGSQEVVCCMADASITHGFEYTGGYERLVQTPLTDKCYFTLTQALHTRMGGSPVGPAGTGKTETVKALGMQLGRHVLVFNCDDTFDYMAVSRIFLGLCQVGAWGCFDEFNRLEERIMSALSLQIQLIQESLRHQQKEVEMHSKLISLHSNVAIFITMNPGYAGRSNLPGNLKQLFRTVTMTVPDRETIAEVMLFAQGFHTAEHLSRKIVPLFRLCDDQFSKQAHYDFGLRALKSVLIAAGKRKRASAGSESEGTVTSSLAVTGTNHQEESSFMLSCIIDNIAPKLITEDASLFYPLLKDFFPHHELPSSIYQDIENAVHEICRETGLTPAPAWIEKICQLHSTQQTRHGIMIVGPSGSGKTVAWKVLMAATVRACPSVEVRAYVIEPKVLAKTELFGSLDITTREWKDGIFSAVLRRIIESENKKKEEEQQKKLEADSCESEGLSNGASTSFSTSLSKKMQHWIVFDGDVDPEWVENLNSVLDDNKILTLPNGERLALPSSVRILFEVENLRYATPATVSRCGMLWFSEGLVPLAGVLTFAYQQLERSPMTDARGQHLTFTMEVSQLGIAENAKAGKPQVSVHHGKAFHELIATAVMGRPENNDFRAPLTDDGDDMDYYSTDQSNEQETESMSESEGDKKISSTKKSRTAPEEESLFLTSPSAAEDGWGGFDRSLERGNGGGAVSDSVSSHCGNADARRVQLAILRASAMAFGRHGVIAKGIALISSSAYRPHCIMELNTVQLLQGVLAIFWEGIWRTFCAEQANGSGPLSSHVLTKVADKLVSYAVVWGLGSPLSYANRDRFAAELHLEATVTGGSTRSVTEVEIDYVSGGWRLVRDRVQEVPILAEQVGANDTVIPTIDTERHKDVLSSWIASGRSAILCGPPGSGKTMSINSVLSRSHEYTAAFLNFSSGTTVEMITKCLEQYCIIKNTAKGFVMSPNASSDKSKLLLFCDEINLPGLDSYGTQSVLQLLRQLIEYGGFFRPRDNAWIHVERIQVIGACNPPTDPGRIPLPNRLLRWAPVLFVDFPSEDSLHIIYTTYCRAILNDNLHLARSHSSALASAMVHVYLSSQEHFTPFQQPHYLYSPRELSRWSRAIYEGILTWDERERKEMKLEVLVRLAVHEGLRVFADRLVTTEEREWENLMIDDSFREQFSEVSSSAYDRPLLFSAMLQEKYSDCCRDDLRDMIEKRLQLFCEEEMSAPLVVYDTMIDHIVRLDRVLRQPLGHMLMAGASGVGKSIIARLSAWMSGYSTFWLQVHRDYDLLAFEEDLRGLLRRSGCKGENICFIFDESNIMHPSFLEYMNALLASGEVPGLYEGEEWVKLIQDIREAVSLAKSSVVTATAASSGNGGGTGWETDGNSARGGSVGEVGREAVGSSKCHSGATGSVHLNNSRGNAGMGGSSGAVAALPHLPTASDYDLYRWFLQNVKERLHVVFTINPSSAEFSSRAVASPALFNRCTIDWLGDWEYSTLIQMSRARIRDQKLLCSRILEDDSHFPSEESYHEGVASVLCAIHLKTCEINQKLRGRQGNRGTFITPRHFTDMMAHFVRLFQMKCNGSEEQTHHLRSGLKKLDETSADIEEQRRTLKESEKLIAENSKEARQMLDRIVAETDTAKKEKDAAEKLRCQLQEEEAKILQDKAVIENDLSKVEPALREAEAALNTVKPEYLREIRAYTTPPPMVQRVLEAVLTLMGERNTEDWDTVKGHIRRDDFLAGVKAFKPTDVKDSAHDRVSDMMRENLKVEAAYRASKAAGPLLQWVFAQVEYVTIYKNLRPLQQKVESLSKEHEKKSAELQETEEDISQKEAFLLQLKTEYQVTTEKIADLKHRTSTIAAKCERATTILGQLLDEQSRWEEEIQRFDAYARTTVGDCILSASFLSYIGFFDERVREHILLPWWLQCLEMAKIPTREHLNVLHYLVAPSLQLEWEHHGLPKDKLCAENAMIMDNTQRFPLLVDPTGTASSFLQSKYATQKIRKASFAQNGYLKQLEMAVRFGYPIMLEDAEFLDPAVTPLLNQEYRLSGGRQVARIGPHEVDLSSSFRLFLVTRDSNYQPSPTLSGQTCLVNFTITESSLDFQCLHCLILHERPDIDAKRSELLKAQGEYQMRLRVLEQKLLTTIAESKGSLLEDDQLISTLASLKLEAKLMQDDINNSDAAMRIIHRVEQRYKPLSQVLSSTFFALKSFSELSSFYQYNAEFIFRVIKDALSALPPKMVPLSTASTTSPTASTSPSGSNSHDNTVNTPVESVKEELSRIEALLSYIFNLIHHRVVRGMFSQDHLVLELRLAYMRSSVSKYLPTNLLTGSDEISSDTPMGAPNRVHETKGNEKEEYSLKDEAPTTLAMLQRVYSVEVSVEEWEWLLEGLGGFATPEAQGATHHLCAPEEDDGEVSPDLGATKLDSECFVTLEKCGVLPPSKARQSSLAVTLQRPSFHCLRRSLQDAEYFSSWKSFFHSASPIADQEKILPESVFSSGDRGISVVRRYFLLTVLLFYTRQDDFLSAVLRTLHVFFDGVSSPSVFLPGDNTSPSHKNHSLPSAAAEDEKKNKNLPYGIEEFFSLPTRSVVRDAIPELSSSSPLLMVCDANYDPSDSVEELALESGVVMRTAAMGSMESTSAAQKYIEEGIKTGCWVLLKNIHLARTYIDQTEKLLHVQRLEGRLHENFRLFLTAERGGEGNIEVGGGEGITSSRGSVLPTNLLEECVLVVLEPPPGIKFSMLRTYGRLEPTRGSKLQAIISDAEGGRRDCRTNDHVIIDPGSPAMLSLHRLYMAAAWVHALLTERLFYVPVGWSKKYEFSDAEYTRVIQAVDACILPQEEKQKDNKNGSPSVPLHVDWVALRAVIGETVYGGKISNPFDQLVVDLLCEKILNNTLWEDDCQLVKKRATINEPDTSDITRNVNEEGSMCDGNAHGLSRRSSAQVPAALHRGTSRAQLLQWITSLPEGSVPPQWIGLPNCVARVMRSQKAVDVLARLSLVQAGWRDELADVNGLGALTKPSRSGGVGRDHGSNISGMFASSGVGLSPHLRSQEAQKSIRIDVPLGGEVVMTDFPWMEKASVFCNVWRHTFQRLAQSYENNALLIAVKNSSADGGAQGGREGPVGPTAGGMGRITTAVVRNQISAPPLFGCGGLSNGNGSERSSPLKLAVQREADIASRLAYLLYTDITGLEEVVNGHKKPAAVHRLLLDRLTKDLTPLHWRGHHPVLGAAKLSLYSWLNEVQNRLEHILVLANAVANEEESFSLAHTPIHLGLLFSPGGFLTAFKQHYAREHKNLSLEKLRPQVHLEASTKTRSSISSSCVIPDTIKDEGCENGITHLCFVGVTLYSAQVHEVVIHNKEGTEMKKKSLASLIDPDSTSIDDLTSEVKLWWTWSARAAGEGGLTNVVAEEDQSTENDVSIQQQSISDRLRHQDISQHRIVIPFYSTESREVLLDVVDVEIEDKRDRNRTQVYEKERGNNEVVNSPDDEVGMWYERGVCLTAWSPTD